MPVVSNTSPISNLAVIEKLDLLRDQFQKILIPEAVERELRFVPIVRRKFGRVLVDLREVAVVV